MASGGMSGWAGPKLVFLPPLAGAESGMSFGASMVARTPTSGAAAGSSVLRAVLESLVMGPHGDVAGSAVAACVAAEAVAVPVENQSMLPCNLIAAGVVLFYVHLDTR